MEYLVVNYNKSPLVRKIAQMPSKIERLIYKLYGSSTSSAVLVNSFPKSGTHLLSQVFDSLDDVKDFGYFITNATSFSFSKRRDDEILHMIKGVCSGELVRGHLQYSDQARSLLIEGNVVSYFIYRDLRDIVVSEAYYLTYMNKWHALHKHFWHYRNDKDGAIRLAITGLPDGGDSQLYRNIQERFLPFLPWVDCQGICSVKYEDFLSDAESVVAKVIAFYCRGNGDGEKYVNTYNVALNSINPKRSHTYRSGKKGGWEIEFNEENSELMNSIAGDLLKRLGYN